MTKSQPTSTTQVPPQSRGRMYRKGFRELVLLAAQPLGPIFFLWSLIVLVVAVLGGPILTGYFTKSVAVGGLCLLLVVVVLLVWAGVRLEVNELRRRALSGHVTLMPLFRANTSDPVWLLRARFHNDSPDMGAFIAKIDRLEGAEQPYAPEPPWWIVWRHEDAKRACTIPGESDEILDFGTARGRVDDEWRPCIDFKITSSDKAAEPQDHRAWIDEGSPDPKLSFVVKVWQEPTGRLVASKRLEFRWLQGEDPVAYFPEISSA